MRNRKCWGHLRAALPTAVSGQRADPDRAGRLPDGNTVSPSPRCFVDPSPRRQMSQGWASRSQAASRVRYLGRVVDFAHGDHRPRTITGT